MKDTLAYRTFQNGVCGMCGGISTSLVGHPFDTMKVRLQTQPVDNPIYSGVVDCFRKTIKNEGILGVYKGVGSPMIGQMFYSGTVWMSYYQSVNLLKKRRQEQTGSSFVPRLKPKDLYLCGMVTGAVASFADSPMDYLKSKMQLDVNQNNPGAAPRYRNVFHCARVVLREHGVRAPWHGITGTMLRNVPSLANFFVTYEYLKFELHCRENPAFIHDLASHHRFVVSTETSLVAGGLAGLAYWVFTYPTDVIKSSMQTDPIEPHLRKYNNAVDCARKLYLKSGVRAFYRGFTPCLMRAMPVNSAHCHDRGRPKCVCQI